MKNAGREIFCQAQFKSSSVPVQLGTETGLIITVRPTHPTPDKYIASTQEAEILVFKLISRLAIHKLPLAACR